MSRRNSVGAVLLAMVIGYLITPGETLGQVNNWMSASLQQAVEAAPWRMGALRASAAFRLDNVGYDSDIYYGFALDTVPDYRLTAVLDTRLFLLVKDKFVLDLAARPEYQFYRSTQNERAWNNSFRGEAHVALKRVYVRAGGGYANIRERMSPELNMIWKSSVTYVV